MSVRVSVVMAVYNGEKYLHGQMDSILKQLGDRDEIIVSVDPSVDASKAVALSFQQKDSRIHVFDGPGAGVILNFETALRKAAGDFIFLCDQDDVWLGDKLAACVSALSSEHAAAVVHDAIVADEALNTVRKSFFEGC